MEKRIQSAIGADMKQKRFLVVVMFMILIGYAGFAAGSQKVFDTNWSVGWQFIENEIEFTLKAPTRGWVSIGFNPSNGMKDAEYILGYVQQGSTVVRQDFGTGRFSHKAVTDLGWNQSITVVAGSEEGSVTTVVFRLPLQWGESYGTVFRQGQTYKVVLAYGPDNRDDFTSKHRKRTTSTLTL
jgi:hypothetical protein